MKTSDKELETAIKELQKMKLITKAYDPEFQTDIIMITKYGVDVRDFLSNISSDNPKKRNPKITMNSLNKYMLKFMKGMESVSKAAKKFDAQTGGAPKMNSSLFDPRPSGGHGKTKR